jgi:uncharacterized protein
MTYRLTGKLLFLLLIITFSSSVFADIPPRPSPPRLVNDFADILTDQQENTLERKLVAFNDTTSNQITIVTVRSLDGYDPNMYAAEIGLQWKVGRKEFDNGVVVLIKPEYGNERGQVAIQSGYGLEPVITDAVSKRIIENDMIPEFRNNNYYGGIDGAVNILMKLAAGEISSKDYAKGSPVNAITSLLPFLIFIIIFILIRVSNARSASVGKNIPFWTAMWLGSSMGRSSGSWNGFSSGGGSSGFGGGGSSFGGFGGGSFGGGGASGSW